jgi:hypothetical protein
MRTADWTDAITVLDRLNAVLEAFDVDDTSLGVTEIARRANLPKSTVSRIAAELTRQGCLDPVDGRLGLGVRLFEFGNAVELPRAIRETAPATMVELRDATGLTVYAVMSDGDDVVPIVVVRGRARPVASVGVRRPAQSSLLGRAVRECLSGGAPDRVTGAFVMDDAMSGAVCIVTPLVAPGMLPSSALAVVGAHDELVVERVGRDVRAAGQVIARGLAFVN